MAEDTLQKPKPASSPASKKSTGDLVQLEAWYYQLVAFYEKNTSLVVGIGAGVVLLVAGLLFWNYRKAQLEVEATAKLAKVAQVYKDGNLEAAILGDSTQMGLQKFVETYSGTASGEIAKFYLANALYQRNSIDSALALYKNISSRSEVLAAAALAGEAACYEQKQQYKQAGELYRKAAAAAQNQAFEAFYLMDAGRAFELAGEKKEALEIFEYVRKQFPLSTHSRDAEKAIARLKM
ncbi:MAG: hypothetical protein RMI34_00390 [Chloroherpetonaceae bacterium]|nr:tetratricopeptide repeat protein [Chloroherpetonaceae bacterium]MCS7212059.1 tetratricopeptide repeat protein [Chloroherpetonaceae bacterium]MDW8018516.1 hypothetical protein [Chloroherpetonaceae bacterium]MDW8465621.1 hypothetical protein [Chloroherpetonaceae bacterium]